MVNKIKLIHLVRKENLWTIYKRCHGTKLSDAVPFLSRVNYLSKQYFFQNL